MAVRNLARRNSATDPAAKQNVRVPGWGRGDGEYRVGSPTVRRRSMRVFDGVRRFVSDLSWWIVRNALRTRTGGNASFFQEVGNCGLFALTHRLPELRFVRRPLPGTSWRTIECQNRYHLNREVIKKGDLAIVAPQIFPSKSIAERASVVRKSIDASNRTMTPRNRHRRNRLKANLGCDDCAT